MFGFQEKRKEMSFRGFSGALASRDVFRIRRHVNWKNMNETQKLLVLVGQG